MVGARHVPSALRIAAVGSAAAAVVLITALPAAAKPLQHDHYSGSDSSTVCDQGFATDVTFGGLMTLKNATPATGGQFFYFTDNYRFHQVVTNSVTGAYVVIDGNGQFKENHARLVSGTVFTYQTRESGQPFVMRDSAGNVVLHDRGLIVQSYVFDTLGDSQPGGELLADPQLVRVSGPHPAFFTEHLCDTIASIIG